MKGSGSNATLTALLIPGYKIAWHDTYNGAKGETHYLADGKVYGTANGGRWTARGTYTIEGTKVCVTGDSWHPDCFQLYDQSGGKFRQPQTSGAEQFVSIETVK